MMKRLTLDEHRAVAAALFAIREHFDEATFNKCKKDSPPRVHMRGMVNKVDGLRKALGDSLLSAEEYAGDTKISARKLIYRPIARRADNEIDIDAVLEVFHDVGEMLYGRVPIQVFDEYRHVERALCSLRNAIAERPDDVRPPKAGGAR